MKPVKKYNKQKLLKKQVKEPSVAYKTGLEQKFSIFNSFEEAEEAEYQYLASLTGEKHLANALIWIKRLYTKELKKHPKIGTNLRLK
jgi:predicted restriction endonuclease